MRITSDISVTFTQAEASRIRRFIQCALNPGWVATEMEKQAARNLAKIL